MHEPAGIYSTSLIIIDSNLSRTQNVILAQARSSLRATVERIDRLHLLVNNSPLKNAYIDPDIPPTLSDLCSQAGVAANILFKDGPKGKQESKLAYNLRCERVQYIKDLCEAQNFTPSTLTDRKVRNSLIHIDEKLPHILTRKPNVGWFIDAAVSSRNEFSSPDGLVLKFCRSFIQDENIILHLDLELSLLGLRNDCEILLGIVFGSTVNNPQIKFKE